MYGITEFNITQVIESPQSNKFQKEILINCQNKSAGWTRFEASGLLTALQSNIIEFEIHSNSLSMPIETSLEKRPFLFVLINTTEHNRRTKKSITNCDNNSTCCKKVLHISFSDIGWDEWIVRPESYQANYCAGSCNNDINLARNHHSNVLMTLCASNPAIARRHGLQDACAKCTPSAYRSISIIYLSEEGVNVKRDLPDMSVTSCSCA
ncbi:inhibin beta E chain-like [Stegodyphus dumicola]|uniref:inhibin beta E chain-like n=1 Tax=Stegodyphus dumicola TaxID=202533 RepID=UPI0015B2F7C3|nr:inhibin beta E chain-like [Stegodyphus dumicola]